MFEENSVPRYAYINIRTESRAANDTKKQAESIIL